MIAVLAITVMVVAIGAVLIFDSASGGDDNSIVTFVPIWFAIFFPGIIAARKRREDDEREKAKREQGDEDIYTVMNRLVDDLDAHERQYLRQRIGEEHGDFIADTY